MSHLWRLVFHRMTAMVDMHRTVWIALLLAGMATVVTAPYFHFLLFDVSKDKILSITSPYAVLGGQLVLLFAVCLLSAVAGISLGPRYHLPVFGTFRQLVQDLPLLAAMGFCLMMGSFVFFDRYFYQISPGSYPSGFLAIAAVPLKGALAGEIILRLGLVTIGVGICRNKIAGALLVAVFSMVLSLKYLQFAGVGVKGGYIFAAQMLLTLSVNAVLGILYVTRGLMHAMAVKFIYNLKCLLIVWLM